MMIMACFPPACACSPLWCPPLGRLVRPRGGSCSGSTDVAVPPSPSLFSRTPRGLPHALPPSSAWLWVAPSAAGLPCTTWRCGMMLPCALLREALRAGR